MQDNCSFSNPISWVRIVRQTKKSPHYVVREVVEFEAPLADCLKELKKMYALCNKSSLLECTFKNNEISMAYVATDEHGGPIHVCERVFIKEIDSAK